MRLHGRDFDLDMFGEIFRRLLSPDKCPASCRGKLGIHDDAVLEVVDPEAAASVNPTAQRCPVIFNPLACACSMATFSSSGLMPM